MLVQRLVGVEGCYLEGCVREAHNATDVGALGADDGADGVVRYVEIGGLLQVIGKDRRHHAGRCLGHGKALTRGERHARVKDHAVARCRHHCHGVETGEHEALRRHRLQVVLVALAQFGADLVLGTRHILDQALDRDDALQIEAVDVVDRADGDLRIGVLHDPLNGVARLANDPSNQIVVGEYLQANFTDEEIRLMI